jgi:hypothetical protein
LKGYALVPVRQTFPYLSSNWERIESSQSGVGDGRSQFVEQRAATGKELKGSRLDFASLKHLLDRSNWERIESYSVSGNSFTALASAPAQQLGKN